MKEIIMEYRRLGQTDLIVSRLCFGGLTIGPLQKNLDIQHGAEIIREAFDRGVNFIDTAELYDTYKYIHKALEGIPREKLIIATKSYAYSKKMAEESLKKALDELNTDYIDIFALHEQESEYTLKGHYEALEYYVKMKDKGYIRAVGISTHNVAAVKGALKYKEIEIIHPIVNMEGLGIADGTIDEMIDALREAKKKGLGIYGMKPLGGGNLLNRVDEAFDFVLNLDILDSIAVGMQNIDEVIANVCRFNGEDIPEDIKIRLSKRSRRLHIDFWCEGCGSCVKACRLKALKIVNNKVEVDKNKCVLCGYCSHYCPNFCIKVV